MNLPIPSLTAIANLVSDTLSHHALGHCQLSIKSSACDYTVITTDGGCITAFELVGMNRFLTEETQRYYLEDLAENLQATLRVPHHKIGITYTRDRGRNRTTLDDIFRTTTDTISNLGYEASHFFEAQKDDLNKHCSWERTILYATTSTLASKKGTIKQPTFLGEQAVIGDMPPLAQNGFIESQNILQTHQGFCKTLESAIEEFLTIEKLTADQYLQVIKEEEELISLDQTGWRVKGVGDSVDFALSDNDDDYITYPPLAYQLVTNSKQKTPEDSSVIESNSAFYAMIDRDTFPITPMPFAKLLKSISSHIPMRCNYEFETGTEEIVARLNSKKTWLLLLLFSKQSRNINSALDELIAYSEEKNGTLLGGTMSIVTWADSVPLVKEYKKEISQSLTAWGSPTVKNPDNEFAALVSSLPAFSRKMTARSCIQPIERHITTSPVTRPTAPMKSGGICMSSLDGRLFPIDPASTSQPYSLNAITGGMSSGKTVFSATFNNTFVFGKGNKELPLMSYLDFGSGVHNYLSSIRSWLPENQHYKVELIQFLNSAGNAYNILEPQFGLTELGEQEFAFVSAFICRIVNGSSKKPVHAKLTSVIDDVVKEFFKSTNKAPKSYESRLANYVNTEHRLHSEINELLNSGDITIPETKRKSWYAIRDKLYELGEEYLSHARFCHRQGSPHLADVVRLCNASTTLRSTYEVYKTEAGDDLIQYVALSISSLLNRYPYIFNAASQIDISQARIVGVDLKGVAGTGTDPETINVKQMFAMLGKYVAEKNFWREPKDFMKIVPPLYEKMYLDILKVDFSCKKHSFMDEYKQMKSAEMDALVDNSALVARKYNMCITMAAQSPLHLPVEALKLCTNLYVLKMTKEDANYLAETYQLSESFINAATRIVGASDGFGRNLLYLGQFNKIKGYVVQILRNHITSAYLWNFASDATDEVVKASAIMRFGVKDAYLRLAKRFPRGSAKDELDNRIKNSKFDTRSLTQEEVILEFIDQLAEIRL